MAAEKVLAYIILYTTTDALKRIKLKKNRARLLRYVVLLDNPVRTFGMRIELKPFRFNRSDPNLVRRLRTVDESHG
jgi:hypothetical protein